MEKILCQGERVFLYVTVLITTYYAWHCSKHFKHLITR